MVDIIEQLMEMGFAGAITCLILFLSLIISGATMKNKLFDALDLKSGKSLREAALEQRMNDMELRLNKLNSKIDDTHDEIYNKQKKYHEQSISIRQELVNNQHSMDAQLKDLISSLNNFIERENESTVASFRSTLWGLHKDFVAQGFITPDGLKTFMEMGKIYERCGGDDIYHSKLLPEIEALEIQYPDENIYAK